MVWFRLYNKITYQKYLIIPGYIKFTISYFVPILGKNEMGMRWYIKQVIVKSDFYFSGSSTAVSFHVYLFLCIMVAHF